MTSMLHNAKLLVGMITLLIVSGSYQSCHAKQSLSLPAKKILSEDQGWIVVEDAERKVTFEFVKTTATNHAGIYIEAADTPDGQKSSESFVKNLVDTYSNIYDNVTYKIAKRNNVEYYVINQAILKEDKQMETTIIPNNRGFYIVVVYGITQDHTTVKQYYNQVVNEYISTVTQTVR